MHASKLLTAILTGALFVPGFAGSGQVRVVDTTDRLILDRNDPGSHAQRLVVRKLPAPEGARVAAVTYEESGVPRFRATVSIGERTIDVDGTAGSHPFRMSWLNLGAGVGVETSFRYGDETFSAFVSEAGPDAVVIEDLARFRESVEATEGWPVVERISRLLRSSDVDSELALYAGLATFGAGAELSPDGPKAFEACLKVTCSDCGGCWKKVPEPRCVACQELPLWAQLPGAACYATLAPVCLVFLILTD